MKIWIVKMILKFDDEWKVKFICGESKHEYELKENIFEPSKECFISNAIPCNYIYVYSVNYDSVYVATKGFTDKPLEEELDKLKKKMMEQLIDFIDNEYELYSIDYNNKINCLKENYD